MIGALLVLLGVAWGWEWHAVSPQGISPGPLVGATLTHIESFRDETIFALFGGSGGNGEAKHSSGVYMFNVKCMEWTLLSSNSLNGRFGHIAFEYDGELVVFSGASSSVVAEESVQKVNLTSGVVKTVDVKGTTPTGRVWRTGSVWRNGTMGGVRVVCFGGAMVGTSSGSSELVVLRYGKDGAVWEWPYTSIPVIPPARFGHVAGVLDGNALPDAVESENALVIMGGESSTGELLRDVWAFSLFEDDLKKGKWVRLSAPDNGNDLPQVFGSSSLVFGTQLLVVMGGPPSPGRDSQFSALLPSSVETVDILAQGVPPRPAVGAAAAIATSSNPKIVAIFGGSTIDSVQVSDKLYLIYDESSPLRGAGGGWYPVLTALGAAIFTFLTCFLKDHPTTRALCQTRIVERNSPPPSQSFAMGTPPPSDTQSRKQTRSASSLELSVN